MCIGLVEDAVRVLAVNASLAFIARFLLELETGWPVGFLRWTHSFLSLYHHL